jgi:hypothetical protein
MGYSLPDVQTTPATPASGKAAWFTDSTSKKFVNLDDAGYYSGVLSRNRLLAAQSGFSTDTYVTNSGLVIPSFGMKVGMLATWTISASKSAAGTASAVYTVRLGSNQSTADTSRLALTAATAQTAVADQGILTITVSVQIVSAVGVIAGGAAWAKTQTGSIGLGGSQTGTSATFDNSAVGGQFLGLSINGGASASWTLQASDALLIG